MEESTEFDVVPRRTPEEKRLTGRVTANTASNDDVHRFPFGELAEHRNLGVVECSKKRSGL